MDALHERCFSANREFGGSTSLIVSSCSCFGRSVPRSVSGPYSLLDVDESVFSNLLAATVVQEVPVIE